MPPRMCTSVKLVILHTLHKEGRKQEENRGAIFEATYTGIRNMWDGSWTCHFLLSFIGFRDS